ncbi:MAG: Na/Pi cotransporter family protein [Bacteroidales bacterium]|nr:Na/Pi cotransporter family protein [Bacteroidales bacterium]
MELTLQIIQLVGSLGLFLFGMTLMSESLQKMAGSKLRNVMAQMTSNPLKRVLTGTTITALVQSSAATTIMVVSFVNAGLLSLGSGIGVIMGANIGTTISAWIVAVFGFSFNIASISIPLMAIAFILNMIKSKTCKTVSSFLFGFSLMFLGLGSLKEAAGILFAGDGIQNFLASLTSNPNFLKVLLFLVIGTFLTILFQSSAATMALTMTLVAMGVLPYQLAAAMVLGENIGTTITANIAASVGNVSSRRAALAHTVFNVFGVIWVLCLFKPFLNLVCGIVGSFGLPSPMGEEFADPDFLANPENATLINTALLYSVATLHTIFNLTNTLILIWFVPQIEKLVSTIIPNPAGEEEFRLKFISGGVQGTAEVALVEARQEVVHFGQICRKGFGYVRDAINMQERDKFNPIQEKLIKYEDITDKIEFEIAAYLNEVSKGEVSDDAENRIKAMYKMIGEMESLGDSGEAIGRMLVRKFTHEKVFTESILKNLNEMMDLVEKAYEVMLENISTPYSAYTDLSAAYAAEDAINQMRDRLREENIVDLEAGKYHYLVGVYYMDVVSELEHIGDFIINISQAKAKVATMQ